MRPDAPDVAVVSEADVRRLFTLRIAIDATRSALTAAARETTVSSCIAHLATPPRGEAHVKGAMVSGSPVFALKVSTGFPGNVALGIAPTDGFSAVFDSDSGALRAIVLDGGYLTELRTAAAGAIALDALSSPDAERIVIIGTGGQARHQVAAVRCVRPHAELFVVGRRLEAAHAVREWADSHGYGPIAVSPDLEGAVRSADAIVTATYARDPLFDASWVKPTAHITAVGADAPGKRELPPETLHRAALVTADDISQSQTLGELQGISAASLKRPPITLGEFLHSRMHRPDGTTIADLTGLGVEDAVMAETLVTHVLH